MKITWNSYIITLVLSIMILFSSVLAVIAQEETDTPEPEATEIVIILDEPDTSVDDEPVELVDFVPEDSPEGTLLNSILEAIATVVYLPATAGIVVVLTSITKRFTKFPAKFIALTIMIVLWGIYSLAVGIGYETQITELLDAATQIGYILLGATGTSIVATKVYEQAARSNVPVIGYSRHVAEYQRNATEANG